MKKWTSALIITFLLFSFSACGDTKKINGVVYDTYGIANQSDIKNPDIRYRVIIGNIVWSAILSETVIAPIYFVCFSLFEPVAAKTPGAPKGSL